MTPDRLTARLAGILFLTAIVAGLAMVVLTEPLRAPDYLLVVAAQATQIRLGALLQFVMGAAGAGIALALYPVLRRQHDGLALAAVGFRLMEAVLFSVSAAGLLSLVTLSQAYANAGAPAASPMPTVGTLIITAHSWLSVVTATLAFCLGALLYYAIMYQARLVPRWLSGFGLLAILMYGASALLALFGTPPMSPILLVLDLPILAQELVLAVWLIVYGFATTPRLLAEAGAGVEAAPTPAMAAG